MDNPMSRRENSYLLTPDLREQLNHIIQFPLTVLEAPMGYGKTTAVKAFFSAAPVKLLWQYVIDGTVSGFWRGFLQLVEKTDFDVYIQLETLEVPTDHVLSSKAVEILSGLRLKTRFVWVIDDYHLIESDSIHQLIIMLSKAQIDRLHIVITSRRTPFDALHELELKGIALHLQKSAFAFGPSEIRKYFRLENLTLSISEAQALYDYTEGWISALFLYRWDYATRGKLDALDPKYGVPTIHALLEKSIFNPLTDQQQLWLTMLAHFKRFTMANAAYVWGDPSGSVLIKSLVMQNAFIEFDAKEKVYRLHNILSSFLMERFLLLPEPIQKETLLKVGDWHRDRLEYHEAILAYDKAGSYENLLEVFILDKGHSFGPEYSTWLIKLFGTFPEDLKLRYPLALLCYGLYLFTMGITEEFESLCNIFPFYVYNNPFVSENDKLKLMGEYELLLSFTAYNSVIGMHTHQKKALDLIGGPSRFMDNQGDWTMGAPSLLFMYHREPGTINELMDDLQTAMPTYYTLSDHHGAGAEAILFAEVLFLRGNFIEAEIHCHRGRYLAQKTNQQAMVLCTYFLELRCLIAADKKEEAREKKALFLDNHQDLRLYALSHSVDLCKAYILALLNEEHCFPKWLVEGDFETVQIPRTSRSLYHIVHCRLLLNEKSFSKLLGRIDDMIEEAQQKPHLLAVIWLLLYKAAANEQLHKRFEALDAFKRALDLAIPDELYILFVEIAPLTYKLYETLAEEQGYRWHISRIKTLYRFQFTRDQLTESFSLNTSDDSEKPKKPLTDRETEIAKLAAIGMSNQEIADKLFVSVNTVKTTLKNVFEKLEIKSRALLKSHFDQ